MKKLSINNTVSTFKKYCGKNLWNEKKLRVFLKGDGFEIIFIEKGELRSVEYDYRANWSIDFYKESVKNYLITGDFGPAEYMEIYGENSQLLEEFSGIFGFFSERESDKLLDNCRKVFPEVGIRQVSRPLDGKFKTYKK